MHSLLHTHAQFKLNCEQMESKTFSYISASPHSSIFFQINKVHLLKIKMFRIISYFQIGNPLIFSFLTCFPLPPH